MKLLSIFKLKNSNSSDTLKVTLLTSVVTGILTISASLLTVHLTNQLTIDAQNAEALRQQRRTTYIQYQDAYNSYSVKTEDFKTCIESVAKREGIETEDKANYKKLATLGMTNCNGNSLVQARFKYQDAVNKMHLDGSIKAINLQKALSQFVPASLGSITDANGLPPMDDVLKFNSNGDGDLFALFQDQTCRDVRPTDMEACEQFSTGKE